MVAQELFAQANPPKSAIRALFAGHLHICPCPEGPAVHIQGCCSGGCSGGPARRYAQHLSVPTGRAWRANGLTELQHQKADLSI